MYDNKHMLKVVQHAITSALNKQEAIDTFLLLPNWMDNNTNAFHKTCTDNKHVCTTYDWKYPKDKSALHAAFQPAKQNTTPARSNMGHRHLSNLEQIFQGAAYYK
jgi:hypothetical protein